MTELFITAYAQDGRRVDSGLLAGEDAEQPHVFRVIWQSAYPDCRIEIEPIRTESAR